MRGQVPGVGAGQRGQGGVRGTRGGDGGEEGEGGGGGEGAVPVEEEQQGRWSCHGVLPFFFLGQGMACTRD